MRDFDSMKSELAGRNPNRDENLVSLWYEPVSGVRCRFGGDCQAVICCFFEDLRSSGPLATFNRDKNLASASRAGLQLMWAQWRRTTKDISRVRFLDSLRMGCEVIRKRYSNALGCNPGRASSESRRPAVLCERSAAVRDASVFPIIKRFCTSQLNEARSLSRSIAVVFIRRIAGTDRVVFGSGVVG